MWNTIDGMTQAQWINAVTNAGRRIKTKVVINGTVELYGDGTDGAVVSISIDEVLDSSNGLSMGTTCSSTCEIGIRMPSSPIPLTNGTIEPYVGLYDGTRIGFIRLGYFFITSVDSDSADEVVKIKGIDRMALLGVPYNPTVTFPTTTTEILNDIKTQYGITGGNVSSTTIDEYREGTVRDWLGWLAGLQGNSAYFSRSGQIGFKWYSNPSTSLYTLDEDMQYQNGVKTTTQEEIQVASITSGTEDNPIVAGNGVGITFTNPYMTQDILNGIYVNALENETLAYTYRPMEVEWRCDPRLTVGDRITVMVEGTAVSTIVMEQKITIEGGMKGTVYCYGKSDREVALDTSPTAKKIAQVYSQLQTAMNNAWALINGTKGGIFEVTDSDSDGINDGFIIKSNPNPSTQGNTIVANSSGIGFSSNGGQTFNVAITTDGHINGEYITAGSINADSIGVGDSSKLTDYIYIGRRRPDDPDTDMVIRIGNPTSGMVQEIRGNRTSIFYAEDVATYISASSSSTEHTDEWLDAQARMYYTDTEYVLQKLDNFQIGDMLLQAQANGGVKFVGAS